MSKITFSELKNQLNIQNVNSYPVTSAESIYLLFRGEEIVYVGISDYFGVYSRFKSHQLNKDFDRYTIIQTDLNRQDCERLEKGLISLLRPRYNTTHNRFKPQAQEFALGFLQANPKFLSHDLFVVEREVEKIIEIERFKEAPAADKTGDNYSGINLINSLLKVDNKYVIVLFVLASLVTAFLSQDMLIILMPVAVIIAAMTAASTECLSTESPLYMKHWLIAGKIYAWVMIFIFAVSSFATISPFNVGDMEKPINQKAVQLNTAK